MKQTSGFPPSLAALAAAPIRPSSNGSEAALNRIPPKRVGSTLLSTPKKVVAEGAVEGTQASKPLIFAS
jgi:hypothetical protein